MQGTTGWLQEDGLLEGRGSGAAVHKSLEILDTCTQGWGSEMRMRSKRMCSSCTWQLGSLRLADTWAL